MPENITVRVGIIGNWGHHVCVLEEREPYYPPLMRAFPKAGTAAPTEETSRGFYLTHVALCARDAADSGTLVDGLTPNWSL